MPGIHALTGCDYTPTFYKKGKKKPYNLLQNSEKYQRAFADLINLTSENSMHVFTVLEEFVCRIYNEKQINEVSEVRLHIFSRTYKANDIFEIFKKKLKNLDASSFPPCKTELAQQLLRTLYITNIWRNAYLHSTNLHPTQYGWKKSMNNIK